MTRCTLERLPGASGTGAVTIPLVRADAPSLHPGRLDHSTVLNATAVLRQLIAGCPSRLGWVKRAYARQVPLPRVTCGWFPPGQPRLKVKALHFHPWLSVCVVHDVDVLMTALPDWPVTLS